MLALSRRPGEEIWLDIPGYPRVRIVLIGIRDHGSKAVIGVDAPREIKILRDDMKGKPKDEDTAGQQG